MCKVLNKRNVSYKDQGVYIGRGSKWGNPFIIGVHGNRSDVIEKYEKYIAGNAELLSKLNELKGKNLICYCAPLACHGDLLLKLANSSRDEKISWWKTIRKCEGI